MRNRIKCDMINIELDRKGDVSMGWLDTAGPKREWHRAECNVGQEADVVHTSIYSITADDESIYLSAKYVSKCYNGIPLSKQRAAMMPEKQQ